MKFAKTLTTLAACAALVACSSGGGSSSPADELSGTWVYDLCTPDADGDSEQERTTFSGNTFTNSTWDYIDSTECDGNLIIQTNIFGTFTRPGGVTEVAGGQAKHADVTFTKATLTATPEFKQALVDRGTTFEDEFLAQGIEDVNNVPLSTFGSVPGTLYTIYQIQGNKLYTGIGTASADGTSETTRHAELDLNDPATKQ